MHDASCQTDCNMTSDDKPEKLYVCEGNPDVKFYPLTLKHKGVVANCFNVTDIIAQQGHLL